MVIGLLCLTVTAGCGKTVNEHAAKKGSESSQEAAEVPQASLAKKTWADATKDTLTAGGVHIAISNVRIGKVPFTGISADGESKDPLLTVRLKLTNKTDAKRITFASYDLDIAAASQRATLTDDAGTLCRAATLPFGMSPKGHKRYVDLDPGQSIEDILLFEPPPENAKSLRLELPADKLGGEGFLRFEIPRTMIGR